MDQKPKAPSPKLPPSGEPLPRRLWVDLRHQVQPLIDQGTWPIYQGACCGKNYFGILGAAKCGGCGKVTELQKFEDSSQIEAFLKAIEDAQVAENTQE